MTGPVIPGLAGLELGMSPAALVDDRRIGWAVVARIVVENALAGIAGHHLGCSPDLIVGLRTQHHLASHTFLVAGFRNAGAPILGDAVVLPEQVRIHPSAGGIAFGVPLGQLLLVLGGALAGFGLFFFDLGHFRFQFGLGGLHVLLARFGVDHELENLVFVEADILFRKLDLVHQSFVLFVGLYFERLVAVLGDFLLLVLNGGFVLAARGIDSLDGVLGILQSFPGSSQLLLYGSHTPGQGGDFVLQTKDLPVGILQRNQVLYVWKHLQK